MHPEVRAALGNKASNMQDVRGHKSKSSRRHHVPPPCLFSLEPNLGEVLLGVEHGCSLAALPQLQDGVGALFSNPAEAQQLRAVPRVQDRQALALKQPLHAHRPHALSAALAQKKMQLRARTRYSRPNSEDGLPGLTTVIASLSKLAAVDHPTIRPAMALAQAPSSMSQHGESPRLKRG
jgi:hypothetical protein